MSREPTLIASVRRALRLLEAIGEQDRPVPAKQLARHTGLPLPTTYHLLRTLAYDGYVHKLDDGGYVLGEELDSLRGRDYSQALVRRIRPALTALRDTLSAAAYLAVYVDGEIRLVEIVDSSRAPRVDLWVGATEAGHATALGKCVLRQLPERAQQEYLGRHPLADLTPRTATRAAELRRRLAGSPSDPLTRDYEEYLLGTACVAVPISDGSHIGSLGVSVPTARLAQVEGAADTLMATGNRVSRALAVGE